jgi:hypothetical protein
VKTLFSSVEFENIQLQKRIKQTEKNIFFQKTLDSTKLKDVSLKVINQFYEADYVNKDIPTYDCTFDELIQKETSRIINSKSKKIFISCGEAPVTLTNEYGQGGRNTHFCAVMSKILYQENGFNLSVPELEGSWIISLATDASDGDTDCAGGVMTFEKSVKIEQHQDAIVKFDTYNLLNSIDALIKVKQTGINLMDLRIIYIHRI